MGAPAGLFRDEALAYFQQGEPLEGDLVRITPSWLAWAAWLLLGAAATAALFATFATIHEYASGPAIVRAAARTEITTPFDGTVSSVDVQPGQKVEPGVVLMRFDAAQETAELDRLNREFELQLIRLLRDPTDLAARQALTTLSPQRELAARRLEERTVRAPAAGIVSDLRIRPGQRLPAGQVVASLLTDARFSLVALLPGYVRPQLRRGMTLRLELAGYRYSYQTLIIDSIGDELVGPGEARRYLGPEVADTIPLQGPVVLVRAALPSVTFTADGATFSYYDGLTGTVEAAIRRERLLFAAIPALKRLFGHERA
jgi:multidrug efflux pump subunit AcrA (membrane-fusion protein)